jgi:hypothetical protein
MCSEDTVVGRNDKVKSKDGKGFSNEIRSGDRRLMKLPMRKWREGRKAQLLAAYQLSYPQPFDKNGQPMTSNNFRLDGFPTEMMDPEAITNERRKAVPGGNAVLAQGAQQGA